MLEPINDPFANLQDDLDSAPVGKPKAEAATYSNPCAKCRGTGRFVGYSGRVLGNCFLCKGTGTLTFKTKPEHRAKARAYSAKRKVEKVVANVNSATTWLEANPEIAAWLSAASQRGFNFAISLSQAINKYGSLTENQIAAARRCMMQDAERNATRAAEQATRTANAPAVSVERVALALNTAHGNGLKSPKLRVAEFTFSRAKDGGKNPGAIYVKATGGEYLGKIIDGKLLTVRECGAEREAKIVAVAQNPLDAAVAYGRLTGSCSCCGRQLTDPVSIEKGIGPICETKFGF